MKELKELTEIKENPKDTLKKIITMEKYIKKLESDLDKMHLSMTEIYKSGEILNPENELIVRRALGLPIYEDFDMFSN